MQPGDYGVIYPNPTPDNVILEKNVHATMGDGVQLAVDVYRPKQGQGPWPVIFAYSPFQKERFFESAKPEFYCAEGYVCVQAAERGSGFNAGKFEFHGARAARDGYELVEWIAAQPWCSGQVAMMGASGYGVMAWLTACLNPPHLKALVVLATTDNYRGLCYPGGVLRKGFVMNLSFGFTQAAIWPGPIEGKRPPMNIAAAVVSNPEDGQFWWEHGGSWNRIENIRAPVLSLMNTPNRLHAVDHLRSYADIQSPKKLVITPWTNENYQPWIFETTAVNRHILRWLDHWLKGRDTGIMAEPEVAVYDNGTGRWQHADEYPLKNTRWEKYYLHGKVEPADSAGGISPAPPTGQPKPDSYFNLSLNAALTASYGIQAAEPDQPYDAVYLSPPLDADVRVWGPVSFTLYAATAETITSDLSFFVKMGEWVPDGIPLNPVTAVPEVKPEATDRRTPQQVQLWSWGALKAKYRQIDAARSRPGMPWHPFHDPQPLAANQIYEFEIELQPVFKTFKKGCRIWLKIASDDALFSTWDATSGYVETPLAADNRVVYIYHDDQYPSHLLLPVIPDTPETAPVKSPLCDALPGAPRFVKNRGKG